MLVALANIMRLSLWKGAHAVLSSAAWQGYAPVEMTILFEHNIPRFQERSAELQIPRLRSG
jgi:hypothetical protein